MWDVLRVTVVGPEDVVMRIIESSPMRLPEIPVFQLAAAPYGHERETLDIIEATTSSTDAFLFTGPVPYDIVQGSGHLNVPAAFIPLNGASLYGCLVRGAIQHPQFDPLHISVDTLTAQEVKEAYAELDLPVHGVRVRPHDPSSTASEILEFHVTAYREHKTTGALTGLRSVYELLRSQDLPVMRMVPTMQATRTALRVAVLLASGARGTESRIAVAVVSVRSGGELLDLESVTEKWGDSLLSAQQIIRDHCRRACILATPFGVTRMLLVGTAEAVEDLFDGFRTNPFSDEIKSATGLDVAVGVGLSYSATTALESAVKALKDCAAEGPARGRVVFEDGVVGALGDGGSGPRPLHVSLLSPSEQKYLAQLRESFAGTRGPSGSPSAEPSHPIVSAEEIAAVLSVTPRSARRLLDSLVEAGLAWALPAERSPLPGRPRRRWRIAE